MMWLAKLLQEKQSTTQAAATCQYPDNMEGKSLMNVSENDFHCSKFVVTSLYQLKRNYAHANIKS